MKTGQMTNGELKVRQMLNELMSAVANHGLCPLDLSIEESRKKCDRCGRDRKRSRFRIGQCWRAWRARELHKAEEEPT